LVPAAPGRRREEVRGQWGGAEIRSPKSEDRKKSEGRRPKPRRVESGGKGMTRLRLTSAFAGGFCATGRRGKGMKLES